MFNPNCCHSEEHFYCHYEEDEVRRGNLLGQSILQRIFNSHKTDFLFFTHKKFIIPYLFC